MNILRDRINKIDRVSVEYLCDTAFFVHPSFGSVEMASSRVEQSTGEDDVDTRERRRIRGSNGNGHPP